MRNNRIPPIGIILLLAFIALNRAFSSPGAEEMRNVDIATFLAGGALLGMALMLSIATWRDKQRRNN